LFQAASHHLPLTHAYLADLPDGLASYPECRAKASMVRFVAGRLPAGGLPDLPAPIASLLHDPPPATSWVPEVHYNAASLAAADLVGCDAEGFHAFWQGVMEDMIRSPLYRMILGMVSPSGLLTTAAKRWGLFHVGTRLTASTTDEGLTLGLPHPPHLLNRALANGYAGVFQALVDHSRRPSSTVSVAGHDPLGSRWHLRGFAVG
jgi:hypothetical protein